MDQLLAKDPAGYPDILLVTGDLSSEGELASHQGFASQMKRLEDAGIAVFVIPGNHDLYNYSAMSFQDDTKVSGTDLYTTLDQFREIYAITVMALRKIRTIIRLSIMRMKKTRKERREGFPISSMLTDLPF